jgi:hypothetical protein
MEIVMNIENSTISPVLTLADIEVYVRHAQNDRALAMRQMAVSASALFKRLAALLRPNRQRLPQAGAWA